MDPGIIRDRFRGCLIGGAAGDALGYPVEFLGLTQIKATHGAKGITQYRLLKGFDRALVSDDTQMTLFTSNGLLCCQACRDAGEDISERDSIRLAYLDWLYIQMNPVAPHPFRPQKGGNPKPDVTKFRSWLMEVPWLLGRRAPGRTCISALAEGGKGTLTEPPNVSKGCGGVMRVAPAGLYAKTAEEALRIGAEAAVITHGNPLGYIPAGVLSYIVYRCVYSDDPIASIVRDGLDAADSFFKSPNEADALPIFRELMLKALDLAENAPPEQSDMDLVPQIGMGWVGEEALAVAVFCAVRHEHDFEACLIGAVNHNGDSDSVGAVAGNLLGARVGLSGIPERQVWLLEGVPEITEIADDMFYMRVARDCHDGSDLSEFEKKAVEMWKQASEKKYMRALKIKAPPPCPMLPRV